MQTEDIIKLQLIEGLGRKTIIKIFEYSKYKNIPLNNYHDALILMKELGLKKVKICEEKIEYELNKIITSCKKENIKIINLFDIEYPNKLKLIEDKPILLYVKGNLKLLDQKNNIAIVGSRKPSQKGYEICSIISERLSVEGCSIVSGFAIGCDEAAHNGCLFAKGSTIAVIPSGHKFAQKGNRQLFNMILINNGLIISELPPDSRAEKYTFIDRNRIIAAISDGILIIEGGDKGGTSHTIKFGTEYKKNIGYITELASREFVENSATGFYKINNFENLTTFKEFFLKK